MSDNPDGDDIEPPVPRPTIEELLSEIGDEEDWSEQQEFEQEIAVSSTDQEARYVHLVGLRSHYAHKGKWSWFLMIVMLGLIAFQSVLLGMVGAGYWDFTQYKWLLPLLLVQNFGQVVGLAVFVVKSLFEKMKET